MAGVFSRWRICSCALDATPPMEIWGDVCDLQVKCFRVAPLCERSEYKMEIKKYWGGRGGPQAYQTMYSSLTMKLSHLLFPSCCCESRPIAVARSGRPCHTAHVFCKACGIVTDRLLLHLPASITTQNFCKLKRKENDTQRTLQTPRHFKLLLAQ